MEHYNKITDLHTGDRKIRVRVAELVVNVDAVIRGENIHDWPRNIQDGIYAALERLGQKRRGDWQIVLSRSDKDPDTGPYVHVIATALETLQ